MAGRPDDGTVGWRQILRRAAADLAHAGVPDAELEARRLVEEASGYEGADLLLGLERPATERTLAHFDAMLARRRAGEPLQYVIGHWGFRTLDLLVDRRVLIPRPETEEVAGRALMEVKRLDRSTDHGPGAGDRVPVAVDLGTGSGAIALSLAAEHPRVQVVATDESPDALEVARANLAGLGRPAARVRLSRGSWFAALADDLVGQVDVVVSNPPYVASSEPLDPAVRDWEPAGALVAGPHGDEALREIVSGVRRWLRPGGGVVLELAPAQAASMAGQAAAAGLVAIEVVADQYGLDRMLVARAPG